MSHGLREARPHRPGRVAHLPRLHELWRRQPGQSRLVAQPQELGGGLSALFVRSSLGDWKFESISLQQRVPFGSFAGFGPNAVGARVLPRCARNKVCADIRRARISSPLPRLMEGPQSWRSFKLAKGTHESLVSRPFRRRRRGAGTFAKVKTPLESSILDDEGNAADLAPLLSEAEIVVGHIWRPSFPPAPRLRLLQSVAAGLDLLDTQALPKGVTICNVFGHEPAIAEYVIMTMLTLTHRLFEAVTAFVEAPGSRARNSAAALRTAR